MTAARFPQPDSDAMQTSRALVERIAAAVDDNGGWLDFESFMQMALYEPGLGYYSAGSTKFGGAGDFTTAPELGDWLAAALAAFLAPVLAAPGCGRVLELGAGSGRLAAGLIARLGEGPALAGGYAILEVSADLRRRQMQRLAGVDSRVDWLDELPPGPDDRVVLANEVADALPVARFVKRRGEVLPLGLRRQGHAFAIEPGPPDSRLSDAVARIESDLGQRLPEAYRSEVCLRLEPWLDGVLGTIGCGGLLLIDYGMPRRDYYAPTRADGTLVCHYRQRAHADALLWPGLQDLSAWVDFSAVAEAGRRAGFDVAGFTTQGHFLLEALAADPRAAQWLNEPAAASALKTLVLPGEMGEHFKVIWLTKNTGDAPLPGRDFRNWL